MESCSSSVPLLPRCVIGLTPCEEVEEVGELLHRGFWAARGRVLKADSKLEPSLRFVWSRPLRG